MRMHITYSSCKLLILSVRKLGNFMATASTSQYVVAMGSRLYTNNNQQPFDNQLVQGFAGWLSTLKLKL